MSWLLLLLLLDSLQSVLARDMVLTNICENISNKHNLSFSENSRDPVGMFSDFLLTLTLLSFHVIAVLSFQKESMYWGCVWCVFCSLLEPAWMCLQAARSWSLGETEWRRRSVKSCLTKVTRWSWRSAACRRSCKIAASWRCSNQSLGSFSTKDVPVFKHDCHWCEKEWSGFMLVFISRSPVQVWPAPRY